MIILDVPFLDFQTTVKWYPMPWLQANYQVERQSVQFHPQIYKSDGSKHHLSLGSSGIDSLRDSGIFLA